MRYLHGKEISSHRPLTYDPLPSANAAHVPLKLSYRLSLANAEPKNGQGKYSQKEFTTILTCSSFDR